MFATKACHNCRRRRSKCDRSSPHCQKCQKTGQECQGYGRLLRWEPGVASRGKMAGLSFGDARCGRKRNYDLATKYCIETSQELQMPSVWMVQPPTILADPSVQDLGSFDRKYLAYYASDVCKDLVLYDMPHGNPFRELLAMTQAHPMLLNVIVANAALHMSNASHRPTVIGRASTLANADSQIMSTSQSRWSVVRNSEPYADALQTKQRALHHLRHALVDKDYVHTDVALATVLLFTEFELLDSGRDTWKHHISGARKIIEALWKPELSAETALSPLRSCLISTSFVFDIIGSTLAGSTETAQGDSLTSATLSLLQDAEGNHCSSFPAALLDLVQGGAQLLQINRKHSPNPSLPPCEKRAEALLKRASIFDPTGWAAKVQWRSPQHDHTNREHIAFAHRAAACIYLSRVILSIDPARDLAHDLEAFVTDIVHHLSFVGPDDALLTASTWPAFIAAAETHRSDRQAWVTGRFEELWQAEPWGLFIGALEVLQGIWETRLKTNQSSGLPGSQVVEGQRNWLDDLRTMGTDWLII